MQALSVPENARLLSLLFSTDNRSFGASLDAWRTAFPAQDTYRACCSALLLLEVAVMHVTMLTPAACMLYGNPSGTLHPLTRTCT
jgi:hypothetical protein